MAPGFTPCREWRTWSSKCTDAGTFRLFGISRINTRSPTGHPTTSTGNIATASTQTTWAVLSRSSKAVREAQHIQKVWDQGVAVNQASQLMSRAVHDVDRARLLAASAPHSGDWLHAPPDSDCRTRPSWWLWHTDLAARHVSHIKCPWDKAVAVDKRGLHGLACRRSTPRHQRHSQLNDIIWTVTNNSRARVEVHVNSDPQLTVLDLTVLK